MQTGLIKTQETIIRLNGGDLHISWAGPGSSVLMSGPATTVFSGEWSDSTP